MDKEKVVRLIEDIKSKREQKLRLQIQRHPANNFRASGISECDRQMVYGVLDWDKSDLYDTGLQEIFNRGNKAERDVVSDLLLDNGFTFIGGQNPIEIKNNAGDVICRGHIDGKVLYEDEAIPAEIKSMNGNIFNAIQSIDDFQKKPLLRKYIRQMLLYLYGNNIEYGLFILTDLTHYKMLPVELDYGECEAILQRLERNWKHVKAKTYPDRILYDKKVCGYCSFRTICMQEVVNFGEVVDNKELEELLNRREELSGSADEYDVIDKQVKESFKQKKTELNCIVGTDWNIVVKKTIANRLNQKAIPDDIKKQYTEQKEEFRVDIIKL